MFKAPFSFNGRIRRTEFGISYIIYIAIAAVLGGLLGAFTQEGGEASIVMLIVYIPMLWFLWAQGAKRCHDRGNSGWFILIPFYIFWMLFADSDVGPNEYGDNPKGIGNTSNEIDQIGSE